VGWRLSERASATGASGASYATIDRSVSTIAGSSCVPDADRSSAGGDLVLQGLAVRAVGAHRVPGVAARDDACLERDPLAGQGIRVVAAVPALVVGADDQAHLAHEPTHPVEHLLPLDRVGLDDLPLVGVELAGLLAIGQLRALTAEGAGQQLLLLARLD